MKKLAIIIIFLLSMLIAVLIWKLRSTELVIKIPFPYTVKVNPESGISCKALVGSSMYGQNNELAKGITAELFKGTDNLAVSVNGDEFKLLTRASLEIGQAESNAKWFITKNDDQNLVAMLSNEEMDSVDIFMLNKSNGMATWTKTRATNFGTDMPDAQSYLLQCQ